jgi:hypothetical protein
MKYKLLFAIIFSAMIAIVLAQQPGALKETSAVMSGRTIAIKYPAVASTAKISAAHASLHTDANLEIQGLPVPKGDYTFYVEPGQSEWELVILKQPKAELGRVPMDMKKASAPAGALTITLTTVGKVAGNLTLTWGNTVASVPFNIDIIKSNREW